MIAVIQRARSASVEIEGKEVAHIGKGLLILLGIETVDSEDDLEWLVPKVANLRIFNDQEGIMNLSVLEVEGELLVVSQFTLHASTRKGNRPSYIRAAKPDVAVPLYQQFVSRLEAITRKSVQTGVFGADMQVSLINDGPVTILIDTRNKT